MKITKTSDVSNLYTKILVVGSSGIGKTFLSSTTEKDKTLLISCESGHLSVAQFGIDMIEVNTKDDILNAYNFLKNGSNYKYIYIDSLTEIGEIIFSSLRDKYTKQQMFGLYDEYKMIMEKLIKSFRDLKGYHIIFTALDKLEAKDFTQVITIDVIQKSLSKKIPALFDEVFYYTMVEKNDGEKVRVLCTDNSVIDFAKDRSGKLDKYERPDIGKIITKIIGE